MSRRSGYETWPRPPKDNGIGHHFGDMTVVNFDRWLPEIKALHIKWLVLASQSEEQIGRVAYRCFQEGIMPIARPIRAINVGADFGRLAMMSNCKYIQIFNEADFWPKDIRPDNWEQIYKDNWIAQAHRVRSVGCFPGFNATSLEELKDMLSYLITTSNEILFPDMWLALHLYPPKTKPPLHPEWPYICGPDCTKHPDFSPRGFEGFARVCEEIVGYPLPMIVTEGGLDDGMANPNYRADWMTMVYSWFGDGTAPDYLLAWCPFILADSHWHGFSWLTNNAHWPMVKAVMEMPEFERCSPDGEHPPSSEHWRVVSPWMSANEALEDLTALQMAYGFHDWEIEKRQ